MYKLKFIKKKLALIVSRLYFLYKKGKPLKFINKKAIR
jgi:hypothetical protein